MGEAAREALKKYLMSESGVLQKLKEGFTAVENRFFGPLPAWRLRWFEVAFTVQFLAWMGMLYLHPFEWLGREGFHADLSDQNSAYWKPWPALPDWLVPVFGVVVLAGGLAIVHGGRWRRVGLVIAAMAAAYVLYLDKAASFTVSRLNVVIFAILATAPPVWSGPDGKRWVHGGVVRLCQGALVALYFGAGIAKVVHGDWLEHHDVIYSHMVGVYRTELAAWLVRVMPMGFWVVQKWLALGFELGAPVLFGWSRLRMVAVIMGLGFHLVIATCFWSIWPFALHCAAYYPLFFRESWKCRFDQ